MDLHSTTSCPTILRHVHATIIFNWAISQTILPHLVLGSLQHNDANGEGGNDGSNDNYSWNCGAEGKISIPKVHLSLKS